METVNNMRQFSIEQSYKEQLKDAKTFGTKLVLPKFI